MVDEERFDAVRDGLFQPESGVFFAPVRHHSPACAWAVQQMVREIRPKTVLVEAPHDFAHIIPHLIHPDTKPPVAIAGLLDQKDGPRLAAYYPFCAHSPEYVALKEGAEIGAQLRFIDQPSEAKMGKARALVDEAVFDGSDFVSALAKKTGCRDGFELWDHLFETRLGTANWQDFLLDVGVYCAGLRASTPGSVLQESGDLAREGFMARQIASVEKGQKPVLVVVGGFHVPALVGLQQPVKAAEIKPPKAQSYLIRYGYKELDALNGYAAGLPQPAYYETLWNNAQTARGTPDWQAVAGGIVQEFASQMRKEGHGIALPAMVEMLRSADALSKLRGRPGVMRHDLIDALKSALLKGEASGRDAWTERFVLFLRGHSLGEICEGTGQPPLVADAMQRAKAFRFDVSDGQRRARSLDIRRKPRHLAASQFSHAMALLDTGFAARQSGPDFINAVQTGLLFENWHYAWSPQVEGMLIQAAIHGDTIPDACAGALLAERVALVEDGRANDIEALVVLLKRGLLAGVGAPLTALVGEVEKAIRISADFERAAMAMQALHTIEVSRGPLGLPDTVSVQGAMRVAFERVVFLCDDLANAPDETLPAKLAALRLITEFLRSDGASAFDVQVFDEALDRVAAANPPAEILGAVLVIGLQSGKRAPDDLVRAMRGQFNGAFLSNESKVGFLRGMLEISASILWSIPSLLEELDRFLSGLEDLTFLELLPHLRLALTRLSPRQSDQLAEILADRFDGAVSDFTGGQVEVSAQAAAAGAAAEIRLQRALVDDGLAEWVAGRGATP
ncbi:MAG: hypothetical protein GQ535_15065 [Rhodobacteraceae bacterium]|nr:hypothetical protein [Paracoccaceae bacterium]